MALTVFTIMGIGLNGASLAMFIKFRKDMGSRTTQMLASVCVSDFLMASVGGTMFTIACFYHDWPFTDLGKTTRSPDH